MDTPKLVGLRQLYQRIREYPTVMEWVLHLSDAQWCPSLPPSMAYDGRGDLHGANEFAAIAVVRRAK